VVSRAAPALTTLSFRRDVRLFLGALVGFFALLIVVLVVLLESFVAQAELAQRARWNAVADSIATRVDAGAPETVPDQLEALRSEYALAELTVGNARAGAGIEESVVVSRPSRHGEVRAAFDATDLRTIRRRARLTIAISTAAAGLGIVLLFFYLPRIVEPIERMLGEARAIGAQGEGVEDTRYLVETFRNTIETMKVQAAELERLHEKERLRAGELALLTATLTRSLTSGFIALDPDGAVVDLNRAAREILGIESDAAGRTLRELLPGSEFTAVVAGAIEKRESLSRVEAAHDDRIIGLTTVPLVTDAAAFLGMMLLFTDVTPMRRLEERLRNQQALADLGEMSAGIAHEFRNALSTILGYLRLAQRVELPPDGLARVAAAEQEAVSLAATVDALLRFARPMRLESHDVDLATLLASVVSRFREQHPRIEFVERYEPAVVDGDSAALRTCFENLVRNAVDALGDDPGTIEITSHAGDEVTVSIRDDGAGVDPADVPRLFLPFQSDRSEGVGLGLPLANKIALLHGGSISMTGAKGGGALVTVTLPLQQPAPTGTKSNTSPSAVHSPNNLEQA
jgi:PAS domain S-box-containing protein